MDAREEIRPGQWQKTPHRVFFAAATALAWLATGWGSLAAQTLLKEPSHAEPIPGAARRDAQVQPASATLLGDLGGTAGQTWRSYDLRPYTEQITGTDRPERAVIDWILRETGKDVWFFEPMGVLSASPQQLRVYHTPEVQRVVERVVKQLVDSHGRTYVFQLHLVTVNSPTWRTSAMPMLRPIPMQTPGVDAWLVSKENAALLRAGLAKRVDYREHNSPNLLIANGQSQTIERRRPTNYVRTVELGRGVGPASLQSSQVSEGFDLTFSPLVSLDNRTVDAVVECNIDQVERLVPVPIHVPSPSGGIQRMEIQVPQIVSWRLKERFRWPADQVLLLTCGVVAAPGPSQASLLGLPNPFSSAPQRADAMLFIEFKGRPSDALTDAASVSAKPQRNSRY